MARKLRFEFPGAIYHIINRGNYRSWIFESDGAKKSFEKTLFEVCERSNWVLHAYVIMGNHYHLGLETPDGNLVDGMRWLQSVFAGRFNRFRKENGALFQGRYKSLVVDGADRLSWLCHYIHLNPVRAGICELDDLKKYAYSSFGYYQPRRRKPSFLSCDACLEGAGISMKSPLKWKRYEEYLAWLLEDEPSRKAMEFDRMSKGWAIGDRAFKLDLLKDEKNLQAALELGDTDAAEARELAWERMMEGCLASLACPQSELDDSRKSADWKVAVAGYMKLHGLCRNGWLGNRLDMGSESGVSRYVNQMLQGKRPRAKKYYDEINAKIKH